MYAHKDDLQQNIFTQSIIDAGTRCKHILQPVKFGEFLSGAKFY